jgi:hypothetical protein
MAAYEHSTTQLAGLIAKRRRCLEHLVELGRTQAELVAASNMTDLMRLLAAKQQLIVALQGLENQLAPFHDEDPDSRQWSSPEERARCAADADRCRQLIVEVLSLEQAGERQMIVRRDEAAAQLRTVGAAGRIREAYRQSR